MQICDETNELPSYRRGCVDASDVSNITLTRTHILTHAHIYLHTHYACMLACMHTRIHTTYYIYYVCMHTAHGTSRQVRHANQVLDCLIDMFGLMSHGVNASMRSMHSYIRFIIQCFNSLNASVIQCADSIQSMRSMLSRRCGY